MSVLAPGYCLAERFTLVRRLGRGGMADVWLARDCALDQQIAIKVLRSDRVAAASLFERLTRECGYARRLAHPNIVRVYDFHVAVDQAFISMDYLGGGDVGQLRGASFEKVIAAIVPIADALAYAHAQGIVHRDVKASNILIDGSGRPCLSDFGIAGAVSAGNSDQSGFTGGTLAIMSPQQRAGCAPDPADDIYSLGVLLDRLLGGESPSGELVAMSPGSSRCPSVLQPLRELVSAMREPAPERRPRNMTEVTVALRDLAQGSSEQTIPPSEGRYADSPAPAIPPLSPPPQPSSPRSHTGRRYRAARLLTVLAFVLLVAMAFGVFFLLPGIVEQRLAGVPNTPEDRVVESAIEQPSRSVPVERQRPPVRRQGRSVETGGRAASARDKASAGQALTEYVVVREDLDALAVSEWGGQDYELALKSAARGDELFLERAYQDAALAYQEASAALERLRGNIGNVVTELIQRATAALAEGDTAAATENFELVQKIVPGNIDARRGLERVSALNEARALVAEALEQEKNDRLELAVQAYERARALDPSSSEIRASLRRLQRLVEQRAFHNAMSRGLAALEQQRFEDARARFRQAAGLRPGAAEVTDALAQVDERERLARITILRGEADALTEKERWPEAAKKYSAVLEIDPTLVFAQQGRARSLVYADLTARLAGYIDRPQRLSSRQPRANARKLLEELAVMKELPNSLSRNRVVLDDLLRLATTPVRVRLHSDSFTDVTVYRVGPLGRFEHRELDLTPGTYTVVGARSGYRDVHLKFTVAPGRPPAPVVVSCREKV